MCGRCLAFSHRRTSFFQCSDCGQSYCSSCLNWCIDCGKALCLRCTSRLCNCERWHLGSTNHCSLCFCSACYAIRSRYRCQAYSTSRLYEAILLFSFYAFFVYVAALFSPWD